MNKSELVDEVAERAGVSKSDADASITAMLETIADCVGKGEAVNLPGYLKVERSMRSARKGRNPRTGEQIDIPAGYSCRVSAGKKLKDAAKN